MKHAEGQTDRHEFRCVKFMDFVRRMFNYIIYLTKHRCFKTVSGVNRVIEMQVYFVPVYKPFAFVH